MEVTLGLPCVHAEKEPSRLEARPSQGLSLPVRATLLVATLASPAWAQMPEPWHRVPVLGEGLAPGAPWFGVGLWAADKHGPPATFVQTLGLGNALTGTGLTLEAGLASGAWDLAGRINVSRDPNGTARGELDQGHVRYQTQGGWTWSLARTPGVGLRPERGLYAGRGRPPHSQVPDENPLPAKNDPRGSPGRAGRGGLSGPDGVASVASPEAI